VDLPNAGGMRHRRKELHGSILARLGLSCPQAQGADWQVMLSPRA